MNASLRILKSPLAVYDAEEIVITPGLTLHETFLQHSDTYQGPVDHVLCMVNQDEVPADQWHTRCVEAGDMVFLCPQVQGVVEVFVFAIVFAVAAVSLMSVPAIDTPGEIPEQSPTYELDAQGNKARLGKPVPVRYGTFRIYPDFATAPYREFVGDDQYLYQLFSIGQGDYDYADLKIGDTPIGNFQEVDSAFYAPGQKVTLFRDSVNVSSDVTDTTLFAPNEPEHVGDGWSGPFVANDPDTTVEELAVDLVFPRGLNFANDEGGLDTRNVTVRIEYRDIDEFGDYVGLGNYTLFEEKTYSAATVDAIRRTIRKPITTTTGRVEVRAKRVNNTSNDYKQNDEVVWTGLKAYLDSDQTYDHSTWAVKAKASDQLSSQNERKMNLVATRKLPIWDGAAWTPITATRNPAWAFCDAIKAEYGGEYGDTHLDLPAIKAVADTWESRNDYFDGQFDTKGTLWAALKKICLVGRAYPYQFGEQFTIIRDEPKPGNAYMFNGRNIKARSLTVGYQTMDEFADDSVEIEYVDPLSWKKETITAAVPGSEKQRPKKVKLFGCTDRTQAHREAMFMAARQEHRNITAEFTTELDGRVLNYLDQAIVVQDLPKWGSGGEVIDQNGSVLTLSEPVTFEAAGDHHIYLRNDQGQAHGPYLCSGAGGTDQVTVLDPLPSFIFTGSNKEKTYFAFSSPVAMPRKMLVEDVRASGEMEVKVKCVLDNDLVHSYDEDITNGTIVTPPATTPKTLPQFVIANLVVVQGGTVQNPKLQLSWSPAEDALRYLIDISYDNGESWSRAATVINNNAIIDVLPGMLDVRIAPQNDEIGLWFQQQITVGSTFATPTTPTGLTLTSPFDGIKVDVDWDTDVAAVAWFVEVVDLSDTVRHDETVTTNAFTYSHDQAKLQGIGREFDIKVYAVNANGVKSTAPAILRVKNNQTVPLTGVTATGLIDQNLIEWNAPSEPDNVGYRVYASQTQGFTAGPATLIEGNARTRVFAHKVDPEVTWYYRVAAFDVWGTDELVFSDEVSAQTTKITSTQIADDAIQTPHLAANSVTATEISASQLSAITADMGTLNAGTVATDSGTGVRSELSSLGDFPLWIGSGAKDSNNGHLYYDKNNQQLVIKDPATDTRMEFAPGTTRPVWLGKGAKTDANAFYYVDDAGEFIINGGLEAQSLKAGVAMVETANIVDAAVDTLKLAGASVVISVSDHQTNLTGWTYIFANNYGWASSWWPISTLTLDCSDCIGSSKLIFTIQAYIQAKIHDVNSGVSGSIRVRITENGTEIWRRTVVSAGRDANYNINLNTDNMTEFFEHVPAQTENTYILEYNVTAPNSQWWRMDRRYGERDIIIMGGKR